MIEKFTSVSQSYSLVSYITTERIGLSRRKTSIFCMSIKPTQKNTHPGFFEITSVTTSVSCNLLKGVMWPRVTQKVCLSFSAKDKFSIVHVYKILSVTRPGAFTLRKNLGGINEEATVCSFALLLSDINNTVDFIALTFLHPFPRDAGGRQFLIYKLIHQRGQSDS